MVWCRCTTFRSIIENNKIRQFSSQVKHITDVWHKLLVNMLTTRYSQMASKNRKRINQNIIIPPLYTTLYLRTIGCTKETFTLRDSLSIYFCARRHHTCRVELHFHTKSIKIKLANLYSFQSLKIITSHLPHRELLLK